MSEVVHIENGVDIVNDLIQVIVSNRDYLSEIDGAIGDGDHGINMAKGFNICKQRIEGKTLSLSEALEELSDSLMEGIGGSMGPLYGCIFTGWADSVKGKIQLSKEDVNAMFANGLSELQDISPAKKGDKCLVDTLFPAAESFDQAVKEGKSFKESLTIMKDAAAKGRDSTKDLVAKIGRASRLGERSKGVLDAGATSCCLLVTQFADSLLKKLNS
ncbi:dihydroxyacetone kinase subunit DhaL [Commensalibacter oyaizuii]|uniref:Dihydroxyacetone kinase subunit DhaL n=1 Tax=Commensalibacter oyaizuii TaxID=3043873 RepID=A0ABT6Q491_9PROT|nr:dihydroxyacetone kinase subunit DhaL [Commensalibacter sp. TBRC 16381]MDI2091391.1 dihydroxyacetone kinase subunit DhaL [Commensalibacter sp. TBRC 16381]